MTRIRKDVWNFPRANGEWPDVLVAYTAALDPIFWLHHANVDRLWQMWLDLDPAHRNLTDDQAWLDTEFSFPRVGGGLETWKVGDVLDTASLGCNYESTAAPSAVIPVGPPVEGGPDIGLGRSSCPNRSHLR
jgi:tyrosinase